MESAGENIVHPRRELALGAHYFSADPHLPSFLPRVAADLPRPALLQSPFLHMKLLHILFPNYLFPTWFHTLLFFIFLLIFNFDMQKLIAKIMIVYSLYIINEFMLSGNICLLHLYSIHYTRTWCIDYICVLSSQRVHRCMWNLKGSH